MKMLSKYVIASLLVALASASSASAQTTHTVATEGALRSAIAEAGPGDTIVLQSNITLTSDLPPMRTDMTLDGGGFTVSGDGQYRGLVAEPVEFPDFINVTIRNLTIADTAAIGAAGETGGGSGEAGLGGALHIGNGAFVTVNNVSIRSSRAVGGAGGVPGGDGGAGLGGGVFVGNFGFLRIVDRFDLGGGSVAGGAGNGGGLNGQAFGSGMLLTGSGFLDLDIAAGIVSTISDDIVDEMGAGVGDGGSWHLQKCGDGTLVLTGNNRYSGGTTVCGGTLQVNDERNVGTGALDIRDGGTLAVTGNANFGNDLILSGNTTLLVGAGRTVAWHGLVSDYFEEDESLAGTLRVGGGGVLDLTNVANSYRGGTIVGGNSTVRVSHDGALGDVIGSLTLGDASGMGTLAITPGSSFVSSRTVVLGATGAIDTGSGATAVLNGVVTGPGGLTKRGLGTLVLNNASTSYGGATHIEQGTLRTGAAGIFSPTADMTVGDAGLLDLNGFSQAVGSLAGNGGIALGTATLTVGAGGATSTFGGGITGSGGLVKTGGGVLTLTGANTYTGGTTVTGGALVGTTTSLQGNILNNATVVFEQSADGTYAGAMSGSGALVKNSSGVLTLTGANTYTGGTTVTGGALVGTTTSLQGDVVNDALVVFDQSFDGTFDGAMSGAGILQKAGIGTLTLTGALSHTGGTAVTGGRLIGTASILRGTILNDASVTFAVNENHTFDGLLAGVGTFDKIGAGTLTITGAHAHTGLFNVGAGVLDLDGTLASRVTVAPNATLRALGTIFGTTTVGGLLLVPSPVAAAATMSNVSADSPFDPAPLLTIGGDLNMLPGSRLSMPVSFGTTPSVYVAGTASFNGATIDVTPTAPLTERTTSFMALAAGNGLQLIGTTGSSSNPLYVPVLNPDRNSLVITILNLGVPLTTEVTNPNASSVGRVLDNFKNNPTEDQGTVIRELTGLTDDELDDALRQISGEAHASFLQIGVRDSEATNDTIRRHVSARRRDTRPGTEVNTTWWGQMGGERTRLKNADGERVGAIDIGSGTGGMDYHASDRWTFGLGGGLSAGGINITDLISSGDITSPRAFGYAGWQPENFGSFTGGATFARQKMDTKRQIVFRGHLPDDLGGDPIGEGINREATAEEVTLVKDQWTDWDDEHEIRTYSLSYVLGYRRATFTRRGFIESGADSLSLELPEQTLRLRQVNALVNMWRREGDFRPFGEFMYRREITDGRTTTSLEFPDEGDSRFQVDGLPAPQNIVRVQLGATWYAKSRTWKFEYHYRNATGQTTHGGSLHVTF